MDAKIVLLNYKDWTSRTLYVVHGTTNNTPSFIDRVHGSRLLLQLCITQRVRTPKRRKHVTQSI